MADIGLVLSGGGARGIAHLGVLQALQEIGIHPSTISGVSVGALIGALYAAGHQPSELLELVKTYSKPNLLKIMQSPLGLFSSTGILNLLKSTIKTDNFAALNIPLYVTATDMVTNQSVTFSKGALFDAIIGSAAIPGLFSLVHLSHHKLADGGILNNLPVACVKHQCDKVIGINVNNFEKENRPAPGRLELLDKSFHLAIASQVANSALQCDLLLEPEVAQFSMFDLTDADKLFAAGYHCAMQHKKLLTQWQKA